MSTMVPDWWVPLPECSQEPASRVGAKAQTLGRLLAAELAVPAGFCLRTAVFQEVRTCGRLDELIDRTLAEAVANPATLGSALATIRRSIRTVDIPADLHAELTPLFQRWLDGGPLVVRSSSPLEDSATQSGAGVYDSVLDVSMLPELWRAIATVWASLFTEQVNFYRGGDFDRDMAVIIQRQVIGNRFGVFFTRHPLTGADELYVETGEGAQDVTAGADSLPEMDRSAGLRDIARRAEEIVGGPADVEFALAGEEIVLLQARPIVAPDIRPIAEIEWAVQEDVETVRTLPLGRCAALFARQLVKHIPYRQVCRSLGIRTYDIYYLAYRWDALNTPAMADFQYRLDTENVLLNWGGGHRIRVRSDDMVERLRSGRSHNQVADGTSCVQVGTIVPATITGFAARTANGDVVVEAFAAQTPGLKSGAAEPATYTVRGDGTVRSSRRRLSIAAATVAEVASITRQLAGRLGEVRLEWYLAREGLFVKDVSIERNELTASATVLSPGVADGPAVVLSDLSGIEQHHVTDRISVTEHGSHDDIVLQAPELAQLMALVRGGAEPPIVVAPYPALGLVPLIPHVAGFVFEHGNLLCHTAIVLREHHVPACIRAGAVTELAGRLAVGPAGVVRLPDRHY